jgi:hypothetical protein
MRENGRETSHRVFIAHSRRDSSIARALSRALDRHGLTVLPDENLGANGERLHKHLRQALESASWYVVLLSEESLESPLVNFEIGTALGQEKPLLPVFLSAAARRRALPLLKSRRGISAGRLTTQQIADKVARVIEKAAA